MFDSHYIKTLTNGLLTKIKSVRSDWDVNDPSQEGYIRNRPFYEVSSIETIINEQTVSGFAVMQDPIYAVENPFTFEPVLGNTYTVIWDGTSYDCVASISNGLIYIGNANYCTMQSGGDIPFAIIFAGSNIFLVTESTDASHTISIAGVREDIHKLDGKYLPAPTITKAGAVKAAAADSEYTEEVKIGDDGKLYTRSGSGIPIFTTSGTGVNYTATVDGITEYKNGMLVVMIPHTVSTAKVPRLNINGLGNRYIRRPLSYISNGIDEGYGADWLQYDCPLLLQYNYDSWSVLSMQKPHAQDLSGTVPVAKGGTGKNSFTAGNYLVGNGSSSISTKTPSAVCTDIGALPLSGGTMTGNLTLAGDPSSNLHAATKEYVDNKIDQAGYVRESNLSNYSMGVNLKSIDSIDGLSIKPDIYSSKGAEFHVNENTMFFKAAGNDAGPVIQFTPKYTNGIPRLSLLSLNIVNGVYNNHNPRITDVGDPEEDSDVATKKYVDDQLSTLAEHTHDEYALAEQLTTKQDAITGTAGQFVVIGNDGKPMTKTVPYAEEVQF